VALEPGNLAAHADLAERVSIVRLSAPDSSLTVSGGELSPGATFG
jgi:hypothetical protein